VAAGQRLPERNEVVWDLVSSQLLPWLLVLPVLLVAMAWAVRRALAPVHALTAELAGRDADALQAVPVHHGPAELRPLLGAMNGMFARMEALLERERRFTADAAHELRTPLAVLRAQWDVLRGARDEPGAVVWPPLVEQAMSDVLPLAERRRIDLACDWPAAGTPAFPLPGNADLLAVLLRNLLDNAVRYAPPGSTVTLRFAHDGLRVENDGPPLPEDIVAHLGDRFHRIDGQAEGGSGLGISIVQRIAALHGLVLRYRTLADGRGVVAELSST
jgi:two-component system, OmpR family, sensor histidine kinase QseC